MLQVSSNTRGFKNFLQIIEAQKRLRQQKLYPKTWKIRKLYKEQEQGFVVFKIENDDYEKMRAQDVLVQDQSDSSHQRENDKVCRQIKKQNSSPKNPKISLSKDIQESQKLRRKVPHLFLSLFKKWAKVHDNVTHTFLKDVQKDKLSIQKRFELLDFHKTFIVVTKDPSDVQQIKNKMRSQFIDFLKNEAQTQIMKYEKIQCLNQRKTYTDIIPEVVFEFSLNSPFELFMGKKKIQLALDNQLAHQSINHNNNPEGLVSFIPE